MEHSIPALLIAAIMVLAAVLMADVANHSVNNVGQSWREMEAISEERLGTDLTVLSTQVDPNGTAITAVVLNRGRTAIEDFKRMDLIVNYEGADLQRHAEWLPNTSDAVQTENTWKVMGIAGDSHNPGILDTGEQMTIQIMLNPATGPGPNRWLVLATDTGIAYTVYF